MHGSPLDSFVGSAVRADRDAATTGFTKRSSVRPSGSLRAGWPILMAALVAASGAATLRIAEGTRRELRAAEEPVVNGGGPIVGDRSPVDLVLGPSGEWLATVNQTSDSVSLVRIADGQVLDERRTGRRPVAIVFDARASRLVVTCSHGDRLERFRVVGERLEDEGPIVLDGDPHGVALSSDGRRAYVALTTLDQVAEVDLETGEVRRRIAVGRWPRYLAVAPDERRLAVGTSGDRGVSIVDLEAGKLQFVDRFVGLNIGHLQLSRDGRYVYFPWMVYRRNSITPNNIRLGWVLASRTARLRLDGSSRREAVSLDPPGKAVADPHGLALSSDERRMVVSASGTHELLLLRATDLPYKEHGGTDHLEPELLADRDRFDRIELGGRPMGVRLSADDRRAYVANFLDNSVQVVDLEARKVERTIALGGAAEPSLARRGEAIFYDARRSLDQWYSCHSCHYDGGTNSVVMDTENDGSSFTFKTVLPLFDVAETGPWTWHGWQSDLRASIKKSLQTTMLGPEPTDEDVEATLAYFKSLRRPPTPQPRDPEGRAAVERGRRVFMSETAGCSACHAGPHYTDGQVHDVGLGARSDRHQGFNTPSLTGTGQKVIWLHDGRSSDLESLLTGPHDPAKVGGTRSLNPEELRDLIAFLRAL